MLLKMIASTLIPKQQNGRIFLYLIILFTTNIILQFSANDGNFRAVYSDILTAVLAILIYLALNKQKQYWFLHIAVPLYAISILMLVLVFFVGTKVNGAQRWLYVGIKIQPSELAKFAVPLLITSFLQKRSDNGFAELKVYDYAIAMILITIPSLLILKQPDLGTASLVFLSGFFVLIYAGLPKKFLVYGLLIFVISSPLIWHNLKDYQKYRIMTMIHPKDDNRGKGYHVMQGKIAIGSGGFSGKGYMKGSQVHLSFVPEKNTDFVLAVLAEEFGFIGILGLLFIYFLLLREFLIIAENTDETYYRALVLGITMSITFDVFINLAMVTGLVPVVGVPLPLISHGGTSSIIMILSIAIISSIGLKNMK